MSFWGELKRRNVVRVGIAYLIVSWVLLQVVDVVAPILELPNWISRAILLLLVVGFVVAIILAWAYELTPDGIKKEKDVDRSASVTPQTGRKLDFIIIGVLSVALTFFALDKFVWNAAPTAEQAGEQKTIAVLPFVNMSADEEQEYFSDGLTEELLNLLARIPELSVTSRTSAFYYKGKDFRIVDVGRELGVAHILEGSVRSSGDTIRVTAQLIDVASDAHVWSETWDRTFEDIFAIQDEIAQSVVGELRLRLVNDMPQANETDPNAYALYLRARHLVDNRSAENFARAENLLKDVLSIDPEFVPAWFALGQIYWDSAGIAIRSAEEAARLTREVAARILELDPGSGRAHGMLASVAITMELDFEVGLREVETSLSLSPNDPAVLLQAAGVATRIGDFERGIELRERVEAMDPLGVSNRYGIGLNYLSNRRYEESEAAFLRAIELSPNAVGSHQRLATALLLQGKFEEALEVVEREPIDGRRASVLALIYQTMGEEARAIQEHELLISLGERWTYEIAQMYAYRGMPDEAFRWLDRAIARQDSGLWWVAGDPFLDGIRSDPRFATLERRLSIRRD